MKPSIRALGEILYPPSQYVIPVFQRNYRWEGPQWAKLWENLIEIQAPEKRGNHFMGFLVFVPGLAQPGEHNTFHLIDGQQRLATCSILLAAVRNLARQVGQQELAEEIHEDYLIHRRKKGEQRYRLLPKERDHVNYLALINGPGRPIGRMGDALGYFEAKLKAHSADRPERLRQVFNAICQRFEFMCATLETENAYNIFKSLNSTGVRLDSADLIRNFVFMHVPPEEQDEFDRDLWEPLEARFARTDGTLDEARFSGFFRDFLMSTPGNGYVPPADTFTSFELRYEATGFSPVELGKTLTTCAQHYAIISGQQSDHDTHVTQALAKLNQLDSSTTYPIVLALFAQRTSGIISHDQLAHAIDCLSGFILRRFICGESSRGYGRIFARAVGKKGEDTLKPLEPYLIKRGWPDDRQFEAAFSEFPLYQRGHTERILTALEQARGHQEPADLSRAQVEHILPQTLTDAWREELGPDADRIYADWLHRPGNLTLSAYNQPAGNRPFREKRVIYAGSNIGLTREVASCGQWGEAQIRERGQRLAVEAARIWIGPQKQVAREEADSGRDDQTSEGQKLSDTKKHKQEFWAEFMQRLRAQSKLIRPRTPLPQYWMNFAIGRADFGLQALMSVRHHYVGVSLMLAGPNKAAFYQQLHAQRSEIEAELGEALTWYELPDKKSSYVSLYLRSSNPSDRNQWSRQHQWLIEKLEALHRCFSDRIKSCVALAEVTVGGTRNG